MAENRGKHGEDGKTNPNRNNRARSPRFRRPPFVGQEAVRRNLCRMSDRQQVPDSQTVRQTPKACGDAELRVSTMELSRMRGQESAGDTPNRGH
jgi:hypothetical protein